MPDIRPEDFTNNLFFILEETFESPPTDGTAYLDKQAGWFYTLEGVTAEEASRPVAPDGTTTAAQVEHTRFYLGVLERALGGHDERVDWRESWRVREVDAESWRNLTKAFKDAYMRVKALLQGVEGWGDDEVGDALAILTHSAYHLGAVRQMIRVIRSA